MKLKDPEGWSKFEENNKDPYGKACIDYARTWADLMETKLAEGSKLEDIAKATSHEADTEGITGFMYGGAVQMLSQCWEHGEQLRKWHNLLLSTDPSYSRTSVFSS